jgi:uncharacterized protein (TIGR03083 family)
LRARRSLLTTLDDLEDDQWSVGSLCDGWTIHDLLAHLIVAARPPAKQFATALMKARGNFDRANRTLAFTGAQRSTAELLADYREVIEHRFAPPGWPEAAPLSDILLHSLDVRVPLDIPSAEPSRHYEPVLELLFSRVGRSFTSKGRPKLRWVATDHTWSYGDGPEVHGTMADLALTAAGRSARIDPLIGEGVAAVRAWLGA